VTAWKGVGDGRRRTYPPEIYRHFAETIGPEEAAALIQNLASTNDAATKDDLRVVAADLRAAGADLRAEMYDEFGKLRAEMYSEFGKLRAEMHDGFVTQTRWIVGFLIGYTTAMTGIALAVAKLFL
jgi:hypothetical protein